MFQEVTVYRADKLDFFFLEWRLKVNYNVNIRMFFVNFL